MKLKLVRDKNLDDKKYGKGYWLSHPKKGAIAVIHTKKDKLSIS